MSESEERDTELGRLIEARLSPDSSPVSRLVRGLRSAAGRAQVRRQSEIDRRLLELLREQREETARSQSDLGALRAELSALRDELNGLRSWLTRVDGEVGGTRDWLESSSEQIERDRRELRRAISDLSSRSPDAVPLDGSEAFTLERFDAGLGGVVVGFRGAGSDAGADVYVSFEDFFRGAEELIRERQLAYMKLLADNAPVLDIGCGRGEMLELLRERGIEAAGIDIDPAMIEHCRAKGLEPVQVADAVGYLEATAADSLGAVFAGQVIEHLPYPSLLRFLRASRAALAPGGLVVMETVNPHAPQALKHFWIDPTHQHPLYPEVMVALCRLTGFASAYIWHPQGSGDPDRDRIEQLDYAVVAERAPGAS